MKVFQIRQNLKSGPILAGAGYQPDLQKGRISAGAGAELRDSPSDGTVELQFFQELWCCWQSVEGEPHEKAVELLKAAQGSSLNQSFLRWKNKHNKSRSDNALL